MHAEIPAETRFVASTVQPEPDVGQMETLAARDLDWGQVVQEAVNRHGVGPLLYRNLTASGFDELVPEQVVERLHQHSRGTATRNLSLTNSLLSLLEHLDEAGIWALPYKGPVLSESIYADFSLRRFRDLDILVRPNDLHDAEAVLVERGFEPKRELTENQKQLLMTNGRQRTMEKGGILVELHPRISTPDPPFEVATLFERAGSVDLAGDSIPAIEPADNLLVLSVHGTRHRWNQLKWICDIAYMIRNETVNWPVVLDESKRRNCYRRLLLGCGLASAVLDVELPDIVHFRANDTVPRLISDTYPYCLLGIDDTTSLRYRLRSRDDTVNRIRYCWNKLTHPSVQEADNIQVPDQFFGVNYLFQPVRVTCSKLISVALELVSKIRVNTK